MAEESKPPESGSQANTTSGPREPDEARAADASPLSADAEKDAQVEAAKARVVAAKEAAQKTAAPGTPKPPVKKKEEGPKPVDAGNHPLVNKLKSHFSEAIGDASEFIGQL